MKANSDISFSKYFDHTLLSPVATPTIIDKLCQDAISYNVASVCVNSMYVSHAVNALVGTDINIASVVGFPLGSCSTETKVFEAEHACQAGAKEIDMVMCLGALKACDVTNCREDIAAVARVTAKHNAVLKVILETCLLTEEEIVIACHEAVSAQADFVKTSTGFSTGGATIKDIRIMKNAIAGKAKIKASGGIRDFSTAMAMIEAGADRLGTSATTTILDEYMKSQSESSRPLSNF